MHIQKYKEDVDNVYDQKTNNVYDFLNNENKKEAKIDKEIKNKFIESYGNINHYFVVDSFDVREGEKYGGIEKGKKCTNCGDDNDVNLNIV